jgi:hypothetical protein
MSLTQAQISENNQNDDNRTDKRKSVHGSSSFSLARIDLGHLSRYRVLYLSAARDWPIALFFLDLEIVFDALDALNLARKLFNSCSLFGRLDDAVQ